MEQNEQNNSFERDEKGLLKSVEYKYKEDGSINWRAMLKPEHLVVQKDKKDKVEQVYGKKISELVITTIDDKYLLILLSGIKHLAALRQYKYVDQTVNYVSDQKAVVTCSIQFVGNFETNNQDNYTLNFEDRIYFSFSKLINYRFLFMAQLKYQHKIRKGNGLNFRFMELAKFDPRTMSMDFSHVPEAKKHQEIVTIHPSISYFINRSNMIEFYVETQLSNTYDKRNLEQITKDQFVFGSALYLTVF